MGDTSTITSVLAFMKARFDECDMIRDSGREVGSAHFLLQHEPLVGSGQVWKQVSPPRAKRKAPQTFVVDQYVGYDGTVYSSPHRVRPSLNHTRGVASAQDHADRQGSPGNPSSMLDTWANEKSMDITRAAGAHATTVYRTSAGGVVSPADATMHGSRGLLIHEQRGTDLQHAHRQVASASGPAPAATASHHQHILDLKDTARALVEERRRGSTATAASNMPAGAAPDQGPVPGRWQATVDAQSSAAVRAAAAVSCVPPTAPTHRPSIASTVEAQGLPHARRIVPQTSQPQEWNPSTIIERSQADKERRLSIVHARPVPVVQVSPTRAKQGVQEAAAQQAAMLGAQHSIAQRARLLQPGILASAAEQHTAVVDIAAVAIPMPAGGDSGLRVGTLVDPSYVPRMALPVHTSSNGGGRRSRGAAGSVVGKHPLPSFPPARQPSPLPPGHAPVMPSSPPRPSPLPPKGAVYVTAAKENVIGPPLELSSKQKQLLSWLKGVGVDSSYEGRAAYSAAQQPVHPVWLHLHTSAVPPLAPLVPNDLPALMADGVLLSEVVAACERRWGNRQLAVSALRVHRGGQELGDIVTVLPGTILPKDGSLAATAANKNFELALSILRQRPRVPERHIWTAGSELVECLGRHPDGLAARPVQVAWELLEDLCKAYGGGLRAKSAGRKKSESAVQSSNQGNASQPSQVEGNQGQGVPSQPAPSSVNTMPELGMAQKISLPSSRSGFVTPQTPGARSAASTTPSRPPGQGAAQQGIHASGAPTGRQGQWANNKLLPPRVPQTASVTDGSHSAAAAHVATLAHTLMATADALRGGDGDGRGGLMPAHLTKEPAHYVLPAATGERSDARRPSAATSVLSSASRAAAAAGPRVDTKHRPYTQRAGTLLKPLHAAAPVPVEVLPLLPMTSAMNPPSIPLFAAFRQAASAAAAHSVPGVGGSPHKGKARSVQATLQALTGHTTAQRHSYASEHGLRSVSEDEIARVRAWVHSLGLSQYLPLNDSAMSKGHTLDNPVTNGLLLAEVMRKVEPSLPPLGPQAKEPVEGDAATVVKVHVAYARPRSLGEARANIEAGLSMLRLAAARAMEDVQPPIAIEEHWPDMHVLSRFPHAYLYCTQELLTGNESAGWGLLLQVMKAYQGVQPQHDSAHHQRDTAAQSGPTVTFMEPHHLPVPVVQGDTGSSSDVMHTPASPAHVERPTVASPLFKPRQSVSGTTRPVPVSSHSQHTGVVDSPSQGEAPSATQSQPSGSQLPTALQAKEAAVMAWLASLGLAKTVQAESGVNSSLDESFDGVDDMLRQGMRSPNIVGQAAAGHHPYAHKHGILSPTRQIAHPPRAPRVTDSSDKTGSLSPPSAAATLVLDDVMGPLCDGTLLAALALLLTGKAVLGLEPFPRTEAVARSNIRKALDALRALPGIPLPRLCDPLAVDHVFTGRPRECLDLLADIAFYFATHHIKGTLAGMGLRVGVRPGHRPPTHCSSELDAADNAATTEPGDEQGPSSVIEGESFYDTAPGWEDRVPTRALLAWLESLGISVPHKEHLQVGLGTSGSSEGGNKPCVDWVDGIRLCAIVSACENLKGTHREPIHGVDPAPTTGAAKLSNLRKALTILRDNPVMPIELLWSELDLRAGRGETWRRLLCQVRRAYGHHLPTHYHGDIKNMIDGALASLACATTPS